MTDDNRNIGENKRDYNIGYGKPPKEGRFAKGQSGNPRGRPKKRKDAREKTLGTAFTDALNEEITARDGTKLVRITRKQMMVRSLVEKSAKGSKRALRKLLKLSTLVEKDPDRQIVFTIDEVTTGGPPKYIKKPYWAPEWPDTEEVEVGSREEPKFVPSFKELIEHELDRKIWVNGPGERRQMAMREIIATQFANAAAAGDEATIDLLLKLGVHENKDTKRSKIRFIVNTLRARSSLMLIKLVAS